MTPLNSPTTRCFSFILKWTAILPAACLLLTGCAATPVIPAKPAAEIHVLPMAKNDSVNELGADLTVGRANQLNLLSPYWFEKAEQSFVIARDAAEKKLSPTTVQTAIAESRANLRRAELVATTSRTILADVLKAREAAMTAGAASDADAYGDVEDALMNLARSIEQDDLSGAEKGRKKVIEKYQALEIQTLKKIAVDGARKRVAQAKSDGARRWAPTPYAETATAITTADAFISANPGARDDIQTLSETLLFQADRLVSLTASGKWLKSLSPEETALFLENYLNTLAGSLDVPDMRDQPLQTQMETIAAATAALKADQAVLAELTAQNDDCQARVDSLNMRLAMLEGKRREDRMDRERLAKAQQAAEQQVEEEKAFNRLQNLVRATFKSNEAELYREDGRMVIRLKAMPFPVGKSTIVPAHYPLLGKLQKVIRGMNVPTVTVEGHTDATGTAQTNLRLSRQRADAVRNYLIKNKTLPPEKITAVGYGSDRPVASNSTEAGRTLNRRIDIVVSPR